VFAYVVVQMDGFFKEAYLEYTCIYMFLVLKLI